MGSNSGGSLESICLKHCKRKNHETGVANDVQGCGRIQGSTLTDKVYAVAKCWGRLLWAALLRACPKHRAISPAGIYNREVQGSVRSGENSANARKDAFAFKYQVKWATKKHRQPVVAGPMLLLSVYVQSAFSRRDPLGAVR